MTESPSFPTERTAVLTGAASARGIGRATADRLASEGWAVAILDIDAPGPPLRTSAPDTA
jgi:2-hydroxycyclohexanecarboxyl-CoA dehydrogenase